ncbi:hypothetical protein HDU67_001117, partial [Dinochytrium kinnereticum]
MEHEGEDVAAPAHPPTISTASAASDIDDFTLLTISTAASPTTAAETPLVLSAGSTDGHHSIMDDGNGGFHRLPSPASMAYMDRADLEAAFRGNAWSGTNLRMPSMSLRIFLSSTFTDTEAERNEILKMILDEAGDLRQLAISHRVRFNVIELRWGIHDTAASDHLTWEICREELAKCFEVSMGVFFVSLASEKYGWRGLPRLLDVAIWKRLQSVVAESSNEVRWWRAAFEDLGRFYCLDRNLMGPDGVSARWMRLKKGQIPLSAAERCRNFMADVLSLDGSLPDIGLSITHWETRAALATGGFDRMAWFHRTFAKPDLVRMTKALASDPRLAVFLDRDDDGQLDPDARALLAILKQELSQCKAAVELIEADYPTSASATFPSISSPTSV